MTTKNLHLSRTGRPTVPVKSDEEWKTIRIHGYAWDLLAQAADSRQEPIYALVEQALQSHFGFRYEYPANQFQGPLSYVIQKLTKEVGYPVSPNAFVTAIKKGKIWGERRKWDGKYQWIVNVNEADIWYIRNIYNRRHMTDDKARELRVQAVERQKVLRAARDGKDDAADEPGTGRIEAWHPAD